MNTTVADKIVHLRINLLRASLMLILLPTLRAQNSQDTVLTDTLAQITVTSSRLPAGLLRSSRTVYFQDLGVNNRDNQGIALDEALQYMPGVFAMDGLNFAQDVRIAIRGFGARAAFGVRGIKVLINGIPATTPDGQTQLDQLDVQSLDRMEVMTGAVGGLYGNASGGAISLHSALPTRSGLKFKTVVGSFGLFRNNLDLHFVKDKWKVTLAANRLAVSGYRDHSEAITGNLHFRANRITQKDKLQIICQYTSSPFAKDPGSISLEDAEAGPDKARSRNVEFKTGESIRQATVAGTYRRNISDVESIESKVYYTYRDFQNLLPFQNAGAVSFQRDFVGVNLQYIVEKSDYRLLFGAETERQVDARMRHDNVMGTVGPLRFDQNERFGMVGLYGLQYLQLSDRLRADVNVRLDLINIRADDFFLSNEDQSGQTSWSHFSPSFGLNYTLWNKGFLYANYGHSFEAPALSELSSNPDGQGGFNRELRPQISDQFEVGLKGDKLGFLYQLSTFFVALKNELIPYQTDQFPGRTFYRNAGRSQRWGLETKISGDVGKSTKVIASYTLSHFTFSEYLLRGDDLSGNAISGIPKHMGNLGVQYRNDHGLYFNIDLRMVGSMYANDSNAVEVPGYGLLHFRGGHQFKTQHGDISLYGGIRNITNTFYYDNIRINAFGSRYYEPAPGRHFFAGITYEL